MGGSKKKKIKEIVKGTLQGRQTQSMDEAEARRQKLQALKERAKRAREGGSDGAEDAPKLKFRNYQPKAEEFKDAVVAPVIISADKELEKMGAVQISSSLTCLCSSMSF